MLLTDAAKLTFSKKYSPFLGLLKIIFPMLLRFITHHPLSIIRCFLLAALFITPLIAAEGNDPSDQFLLAYQNFQQGERLEREGNSSEAIAKYHFAESVLLDLATTHPDWQKAVVDYRLHKVRDDLERIGASASLPENTPAENNGHIESMQKADASMQETTDASSINKISDIPSISIIPPEGKKAPSEKEVLQLQKQLKKAELDLQKARSEITDKTMELDGKKVIIIDMKSQLENAQRQVADLKGDLIKIRSGSTQREAFLKKSVQDLEGKVTALSADQEVMAEENSRLQERLKQSMDSLVAGLDNKKRLEKLQLEMNAEKNASAALHEKMMAAEQERDFASNQNKELQRQLQEANAELPVALKQKQEFDALTAQVATLTKENTNKANALAAIEHQTNNFENSRKNIAADFEKKLIAAQADQEVIAEEKKSLEAKLQKAADEIEVLQKIGADAASLREQVTTANQQLENTTKRLVDAEASRKELAESQKQALSDIENKLQVAVSERKDLQSKKTDLEKQLSDMSEKIKLVAQSGATTEAINAEISQYKLQLQQSATQLADAQNKIADLEKAQPEKDHLLQAKEKELTEARQESDKLQKDLFATTQKLSSLQAEVQLKDDRYNELKKTLDQKNSELLEALKKGDRHSSDEKMVAENELLKGIVLRELKAEAKRQQTRKLITEDLEKLKINSDTLSSQLKKLARPVKLTEEEKALFKDKIASLALPPADDEGDDKLMVSVAATKKDVGITKTESIEGTNTLLTNDSTAVNTTNSTTNQGLPLNINKASTTALTKDEKNSSKTDPETQHHYQEIVAKAKEQFEHQNYTEAEKSFQDALAITPNDYLTLSNLGVVEFQLGKMSEAETILKKACSLDHRKSFSLTTLGIVHYRQERLDDSEKALRQALAVNEQDFTAHNYLGIVLAASGKSKAGESEIMKSLEINPQYADAHFNLAVIYATGKPPAKELAKTHYEKARSLGAPPDSSLEKLLN